MQIIPQKMHSILSPTQQVVRFGMILLSIILIAIITAKSAYLVLNGPSFLQVPVNGNSRGIQQNYGVTVNVDMLARITPFSGVSNLSDTSINQPLQPDAPETELDIVLNGVRADGLGNGVAFISTGGNDQYRYIVGENIAGMQGVSIKSIYADGVLLSRNGRIERLSNQHADNIGIQSVNSGQENVSVIPSVEEAKAEREVESQASVSEALEVEASEPVLATATISRADLLDILSWARWDENTVGDLPGVTVFPLDSSRFSKSGLKTRDIVQKIAGMDINSVNDFENVKTVLESAQRITIELVRNKEIVYLTVNVNL